MPGVGLKKNYGFIYFLLDEHGKWTITFLKVLRIFYNHDLLR